MNEAAMQISLKEFFAVAGSRYTDNDAMVIGPELEKLAIQGRSTACAIVESARNEKSPLHSYFEWRDGVAASLYREEQARYMARSIAVKVVDAAGEEKEIRAFFSAKVVTMDSVGDRKGQKQRPYVTVDRVQGDKEIANQIINDALSQLISWKAKYAAYRSLFKEFEQLSGVFDAINSLEEQTSI